MLPNFVHRIRPHLLLNLHKVLWHPALKDVSIAPPSRDQGSKIPSLWPMHCLRAAMLWTKDIHLGLDQWSSLPDEHQNHHRTTGSEPVDLD